MSRIFYTSHNGAIRPAQKIGIGGEGEVYEIQDHDDLVVKLYHEIPSSEKAEKLVVLSRLGTERLLKLSAWPIDVVRDRPDGNVAGFVMNKISQGEEVHTLHSPKSRLQKFPEASWAFLIYVAANIARAVAAVHDHGFVIGDVNPKNILVTKKATVYLLDCDSFQVSVDGKIYRCDAGFPEYIAPELQGRPFKEVKRFEEHDYFGLAVVIFQLLFLGRHPFSGRFAGAGEMPLERAIREFRFAYGADAESRRMRQPPGTLPLDAMPEPIVKLFRRAFLTTGRPQPRAWIEPLDALAKSLKKCGLHSGHYFYRELRNCPWCGIESHARVRLFNFLLAGSDGNRGPFPLDEIWKEIESIPAPTTALTPHEKQVGPLEPSAEVIAFAHERRVRFILSIAFSFVAGLLIPLLADFPLAFFLLILSGIGAFRIAKAEKSMIGQTQLLFHRQQAVSDEPLVEKVEYIRQHAEDAVRRIEERWEKEASNARFLARLDELKTQKNVYANLPRFREQKLKQLEAAAREEQLDEFLDQFEVSQVDIRGVFYPVKISLLSNGVETAADLTEQKLHKLREIPTVGPFYTERLSEWRRDLERGFVFDPAKSISPQARIAVEKEIDSIRFRLEHEISSGPFYLRRVKQEIEERSRELQPVLSSARQSLAQAEKDLEVAGKNNSFKPIFVVLLIAFFLGTYLSVMTEFQYPIRRSESSVATERSRPQSSTLNDSSTAHPLERAEKIDEALKLYHQGVKLSREGKFVEAVEAFQRAVELDPRLNDAYEEIGYALYRLGMYDESINASRQAIILNQDFGPYYNLGLAYVAQKQWDSAKTAFEYAIAYSNSDEWVESYSYAYYYKGLSLTRLGEAEATIEGLENNLRSYPILTVERFELANLYLWVGRHRAARTQYRILKGTNEKLAEELRKLMVKHERRRSTN